MMERLLQLPADGGVMPVFVTHPERHAPFPAVLLYMDFWGVREEIHDLARHIAAVGYYCLVPDFYYRQGSVRIGYRDANGRMISYHLLGPEEQRIALEPMHRLDDESVMRDTEILLRFLRSGEPVSEGAMGCIGYCMGGRHVVQAGARFPDDFRAMASLHPTSLVTESETSPHQIGRAHV